jgi:hypothetical protein
MKDSGISKLVYDYIARGRGNVGHQEQDGQTNSHEDGAGRDDIYVAADYIAGYVRLVDRRKGRSMLCRYFIF